eukprot:1149064-Pelagomonas_calceolata.AAC.7
MQATPASHCLPTPPGQPAADNTPEASSPTHQSLLLIASANFHAFTSLSTEKPTPSSDYKLNIPSQLELRKSVSSAASWNGLQMNCETPENGPPPGPSKGIHKSMTMKFVLAEAVPGARGGWTGKSKPTLLEPLFPNSARCIPGRQNLTAPVNDFAWQACRVSGWLVVWLALAKNCLQNSLQTFLQCQPLPPPHTHCRTAKTFCSGSSARIPGLGVPWAGLGSQALLEGVKPRGPRTMNRASTNIQH